MADAIIAAIVPCAKQITHGVKVKIFPNETQRAQLDLWRRRCISLWNVMLGIEQAAYSGEKFRPELGWRRIWADVVRENHEAAVEAWNTGKKVKAGKHKGKTLPPRMRFGKDGTLEAAPQPEYAPDVFRKISGGRVGGEQPKLFIWAADLMKIMARLKKVALTEWIGEIQSHACQAVCKDIDKAINKMISERKKGDAGQNAGFPRFKKHGYADGSVYFANTQVTVDWAGKVKISNGIGDVPCGPIGNIPEGAKLGEARAWREGEQWWLSCIFSFPAPTSLPATGRKCGVKVAAANVYTIFDGENFTQVKPYRPSVRDEALLAIKGRKATRKVHKSKGWYKAQVALARDHAHRKNSRSDVIHKGSRAIVNAFDAIAIDKMDIMSMVKASGKPARERIKALVWGGNKALRKIVAQAGMYDAMLKVAYKAKEAGRVYNQTHVLFPSTQICHVCGKIHVDMADGRRYIDCECGSKLQRQENASANLLKVQQTAK